MEFRCSILPSEDEVACEVFTQLRKHKPDYNGRTFREISDKAQRAGYELRRDCLQPRIEYFCNGIVRVQYRRCARHSDNLKPFSPEEMECAGALMSRLAVSLLWMIEGEGDTFKIRHAPGASDEEKDRIAFDVLKPVKRHARGCLLSDRPEVCVAGLDVWESLYFKRCNGSHRNLVGDALCSQDQQAEVFSD